MINPPESIHSITVNNCISSTQKCTQNSYPALYNIKSKDWFSHFQTLKFTQQRPVDQSMPQKSYIMLIHNIKMLLEKYTVIPKYTSQASFSALTKLCSALRKEPTNGALLLQSFFFSFSFSLELRYHHLFD